MPKKITIAISAIALILAVVHVIWPDKIDLITVVLLAIALLPWLPPLVRSLQLPGGWIIEFRDVKEASDKILRETEPARPSVAGDVTLLERISEENPGLSLVAVRIEIEKRVRKLAEKHNIDTEKDSLRQILKKLRNSEIITASVAGGLEELVMMGNKAAHGAEVSPNAATWALHTGPEVLGFLDRLLEND